MDKRVEHIRKLVSGGKIKEAIDKLHELVESESNLAKYQNDIILLNARYKEIQNEEVRGISSIENRQLSKNKLNNSILQLTVNISLTLENREPTARTQKKIVGCAIIILPLIVLGLFAGLGGLGYHNIFNNHKDDNIIIFGKVYDSDNKPVKNARVEVVDLIGIFSFTDDNGAFEFEIDKPDKRYLEFQVYHGDYEIYSSKILMKPNRNNEQSLEKFLLAGIVTKEKETGIVDSSKTVASKITKPPSKTTPPQEVSKINIIDSKTGKRDIDFEFYIESILAEIGKSESRVTGTKKVSTQANTTVEGELRVTIKLNLKLDGKIIDIPIIYGRGDENSAIDHALEHNRNLIKNKFNTL